MRKQAPFPACPSVNVPDFYLLRDGRSGGHSSGTLEFLIISTATGHLATGYTMGLAVSLATVRLIVGDAGMDAEAGAARQTGRQMD